MGIHYNTVDEFIEDCELGLDIEFRYGAYGYTVLAWFEGGPLIGRQHPYDDIEQQFKDANDMLDNFYIEGKKLRDIILQIEL